MSGAATSLLIEGEPLAPRLNSNLLGQDEAETLLREAWDSGRLPHAWLMTGPRGVGKATLAFRFARFVLANGRDAGGTPVASGLALAESHPIFRRVASGGHSDLLVIERGIDPKRKKLRSEIVVDDVREAARFLHLTPAEGEWRVVIVDTADEMNRNAANALLKILEEPPRQSLLLLVSHAPGRLLPTIRSRCRRLRLPPLDTATIDAAIAASAPDLPDEDRQLLPLLAEGSLGRALELAASGGLDQQREVMELLLGLPALDTARLHELADRLAGAGNENAFRAAAELVLWWLARFIRFAQTGRGEPEIVAGEAALMHRLRAGGGLDRWLALWDKLGRLFALAAGADLDRKQVWIGAFLDMSGIPMPLPSGRSAAR
ncbi:MAG: DNA polymerase III subunit delta' [Dongiaceae bacterium]